MYTPFKIGFDNMVHMRISGTELSLLMLLAKQSSEVWKGEKWFQKVP